MKTNVKYAFLSVILITLTAVSPLLVNGTVEEQRPMVVGTIGTITHLDPHKTYWSSDINTFMQSCEGLFQTNLSDGPLYPIAPYLAASWGTWDADGLTWTIPLREGVTFHDGTPFNASIVEWNYARIQAFMEAGICEWETLAKVANRSWGGETPGASAEYNASEYIFILNNVTVVDEYTVSLGFHYKDARALSLMAYQGWVFISPNSVDPADSAVVTLPPLVGTGPYILQSIEADGSRTFVAYEDYWRGVAQVKEIRIQWVSDSVTVGVGMLGGPGIRSYDMGGGSPDQWDEFRADETLTFVENIQTTVYYYIGINTDKIALSIRKALSQCLNISYFIDIWFEGNMNYMTTPVTPGIPYSKIDCDVLQYNVEEARQHLIDDGLVTTLTATDSDAEWIALTTNAPVATYNVSYREGSTSWGVLAELLVDNAELIGIEIEEAPMDSASLDLRIEIPANQHMVDLFFLGWGPDYLDPHNMIWDAFAGPEAHNPMRIGVSTDTAIAAWRDEVAAAVLILDPVLREAAYAAIQCELMEDIVPWIPMMNLASTSLHTTEVTGDVGYNPFNDIYYYAVRFNPAAAPTPVVIPGYELVSIFTVMGFAALYLIRKSRK